MANPQVFVPAQIPMSRTDSGCYDPAPASVITREPAGHDYHLGSLVSNIQAQTLCLTLDAVTRHQRRSFTREPAGHEYHLGSLVSNIQAQTLSLTPDGMTRHQRFGWEHAGHQQRRYDDGQYAI